METDDATRRGSTRIVLDGDLDARAAADLLEHCRRRDPEPAAEVVVDVGAVRTCDADGLRVLLALYSGDAGPGVVLHGVRWSQFFGLLVEAPLQDVGWVRQQVRQLVWDARRDRRGAREGVATS
ncbi:STAS domain-containing protein [Actinomycetospora sp. CA-101289]|uniref:STAS domain-containing protein n=1 Tax=Actinomycetospora sp. CA-101289 TaxID=3239893 RepID=UPI003D984450